MNVRSIARTVVGALGSGIALAAIVYAAPGTPVQASVPSHGSHGHTSTPPRWLSWTGTFRDHGTRCVYIKGGHGPRVGEVCANGTAHAYTVHGSAPLPSAGHLPPWFMWTSANRPGRITAWGGYGDTSVQVSASNAAQSS